MKFYRVALFSALAGFVLHPAPSSAEYYSFDVPSGADIVMQQVRYPFWAESTYNAIWTNQLIGDGKADVYFYGGVPEADPNDPAAHPANIIWSFWPVSHPVNPGETVKVAWGNPQMYAPLSVGEGASGKASGQWPQLQTRQWYSFVLRIWQPLNNRTGHAFAAQWMKDPADGQWYHVATMDIPFQANGTSGLGGFIEDFSHGNRNPRRTEFRNVYSHSPAQPWKPAKEFTPSVRQHGEKGTVDLIDGGTAAFYETCSGENYKGNLDFDNHIEKRTVTLNEPDVPAFDPPAVDSVTARRADNQLLLTWNVPVTAAPQFAWKVESIDGAGTATLLGAARDPDARQCLIDTKSAAGGKVRLTLTDIFDHTITAGPVTPEPSALQPAVTYGAVKPGLDFAYYEAADTTADWDHLPRFADLKPVLAGTVNGIDLTVRRRRTKYALRYWGFVKVPANGIYGFKLGSYDGSRLLVDGKPVVDNDGVHSYTDKSSNVSLSEGLHPVELQYFRDTDRGENCSYADRVNLSWIGPGIAMEPVPLNSFYRKYKSAGPVVSLVAPGGSSAIMNTPVRLDVNLSYSAGAIQRVVYYMDDVLWASRQSTPWMATVTLPKGTFAMRARVFTSAGESFDTAPVRVSTRQTATGPWEVAQIGTPPPRRPLGVAVKGDSVYLVGDGNGIACQDVVGDATITAHVAERPDSSRGTQEDGTVADGNWMGGVLFRSDLVAHDTFLGEQFCTAYARADGTTHMQCPLDHNGGGPVPGPDLGTHDWIRLERTGNTFTTRFSTDGETWTKGDTRTLDLPQKLHAGVFIYSTPGYLPQMNGWRFDHVSVSSKSLHRGS